MSSLVSSLVSSLISSIISSLILPPPPPSGGTTILLVGASLRGASVRICRFGLGSGDVHVEATHVPATLAGARDALACETPAAESTGAVSVAVSLNGQQWFLQQASFTYSVPAAATRVVPDISPNSGGLVIEVLATELEPASERHCRFGAHMTVPATLEEGGGGVPVRQPRGRARQRGGRSEHQRAAVQPWGA